MKWPLRHARLDVRFTQPASPMKIRPRSALLPRPAAALLAVTLTASAQDFSASGTGSASEMNNLGAIFSQSLGNPATAAPPATVPYAPPARPPAIVPSARTNHTTSPLSGQTAPAPSMSPTGGTQAVTVVPAPALVISLPPHAAQLAQLRGNNPFDPDRRLWPDRIPPPPPPPPPPAPSPISEDDMQLYGVTIVGERRLATVKVGSRFAQLAPAGRSFVTLGEGQAAGEFVVRQVAADRLVLEAAGGRQVLQFTRKSDRGAGGAALASTVPPPVQAAIELPASAVNQAASGSLTSAISHGTANARPASTNDPSGQPSPTAADLGTTGTNPSPTAPAVSLLEALAAARAQVAQNPNQGMPTPGNPFGANAAPSVSPSR